MIIVVQLGRVDYGNFATYDMRLYAMEQDWDARVSNATCHNVMQRRQLMSFWPEQPRERCNCSFHPRAISEPSVSHQSHQSHQRATTNTPVHFETTLHSEPETLPFLVISFDPSLTITTLPSFDRRRSRSPFPFEFPLQNPATARSPQRPPPRAFTSPLHDPRPGPTTAFVHPTRIPQVGKPPFRAQR